MLINNLDRTAKIAEFMLKTYRSEGIFGIKCTPEIRPPKNVKLGPLEHRQFITFSISIDYLRDSTLLWEAAWKAYENPKFRYLFNPEKLFSEQKEKIALDLQKAGMGRYFNRDAQILQKIAFSLINLFNSDPINIFEKGDYDGIKILEILNKYKSDFPFLSGKKIAPHWIRTMDDICNSKINLKEIPIPVDVNITRATFSIGGLVGKYEGSIQQIREKIEKLWFDVSNILTKKYTKKYYPLLFQQPLWILSKFGCSNRKGFDNLLCPIHFECSLMKYCVKGLIKVAQREKGIKIETSFEN